MAHYLGGKLEFLTFRGSLKLMWWAVRNDVEVKIVG